MQALVHLRDALARKIFLTATLAPNHEDVLAKAVGISLSRTLVLRLPTARPNHKIQIAHVPHSENLFPAGIELASILLETWKTDKSIRGIIFVRSIKKLDKASHLCQFPICTYSGSMSNQQKETQLSSWLSDEQPAKWMISTTGLLHGVDYPRVDAVIFLEFPFGLYDFVQGAGRAGRSGQESLIVVIHSGPPGMLPDENQYGCRVEMDDVVMSPTCRRASISKVMDGQKVSCSQISGALFCDSCEGKPSSLITQAINNLSSSATQNPRRPGNFVPRSPPRPSPTALITGIASQASTNDRRDHSESVRDLMERFSGCFACRIKHPDHGPCHAECGSGGVSGCGVAAHIPYRCTDFEYKNGWIDWRKKFNWPKDGWRCYFCGLPGSAVGPDHRVEDRRPRKYPGKCKYSDTAVVAAWHVLHSSQLFEQLQKDLGFVAGEDAASSFAEWLVQYGSESEDIRLFSVFSWLCRQFYPDYPRCS
jgi:Helicase conserved C-terminal domain